MRITLCLVSAVLAACTTTSPPSTPPGADAPRDTTSPTATAVPSPTPSSSPTLEETVVVMWARGGLPADVASRAALLPGVTSAAHVRSDTLSLTGSRSADGTPVDDLDPGWQIPVEVRAIDPAAVAEGLPPGATRDAVASLVPGQVLLPETSAERRGLQAGAQIDLAERRGLQVAAVIEDDVLGRDEVVVHAADADAVGLEPDGSVRLVLDGPPAPGFADDLEALAPADTAVRVVGLDEDQTARRAPLVLGLSEVKDRFGEFAFRDDDADREVRVEPAWVDEHIVVAEVPVLGRVRCHRAIVDDLRAALQAVVDAGLAGTIVPADYGGCFHARRIGSHTSSLSHHSWGIAIDINVDISQPGLGPPPSSEFVDAFADHGFRWGGLFLSPDNHHFEWVGEAARQDPPPAGVGADGPDDDEGPGGR